MHAVWILWKSCRCSKVLHKNNKRDAAIWNTGEVDVSETNITPVPGKD